MNAKSTNQKLEAYAIWKEELNEVWDSTKERIKREWSTQHPSWNQKLATPSLALKLMIVERDQKICRYCGIPLSTSSEWEFDHVYPFSKGGETTIKNLVLACKKCNHNKLYLHGIKPIPLSTIKTIVANTEKALTDSRKRQIQLYKEWKELFQNPEQHKIEMYYFLYKYDHCEGNPTQLIPPNLKKIKRFSELCRVYDLDEWIRNYKLRFLLRRGQK